MKLCQKRDFCSYFFFYYKGSQLESQRKTMCDHRMAKQESISMQHEYLQQSPFKLETI